jgi:hypothetical protein
MTFYVYAFYADDGAIAYVGKGKGPRFKRQEKRFAPMKGKILKHFKCEDNAFHYEWKLIEKHSPALNKCKGRNCKPAKNGYAYLDKELAKEWKEMERVGTRVYAARVLIRFDLRPYFDADRIDRLHVIANSV